MRTKDIAISEIVYYGGEDSESIPAGFVAEWRFEKPKSKKKKSNEFKDGYKSEMRYIKNRLAKANIEHVRAGSLAKKPNG